MVTINTCTLRLKNWCCPGYREWIMSQEWCDWCFPRLSTVDSSTTLTAAVCSLPLSTVWIIVVIHTSTHERASVFMQSRQTLQNKWWYVLAYFRLKWIPCESSVKDNSIAQGFFSPKELLVRHMSHYAGKGRIVLEMLWLTSKRALRKWYMLLSTLLWTLLSVVDMF